MSYLESGHGTLFEFSLNQGLLVRSVSTTPPGVDGGDPNDVTTHLNQTVTTKAPRVLRDFTNASQTVAYDPACLPQILAMVNQNQSMKSKFNDGSSWTYWGWIKSFTPNAAEKNGDMPTAEMEIVLSNRNASFAETVPVYSATGGTPTTTSTTVTTTTPP